MSSANKGGTFLQGAQPGELKSRITNRDAFNCASNSSTLIFSIGLLLEVGYVKKGKQPNLKGDYTITGKISKHQTQVGKNAIPKNVYPEIPNYKQHIPGVK